MAKLLLAHDLGTSGNKATLFDETGKLIKSAVYAYDTVYSANTWAEQDPRDFWAAVCGTTNEILRGINNRDVAAVSFSGQMMGVTCLDQKGEPLRNHIIWADQRSVRETAFLRERIGDRRFYEITGQPISPTYGLPKILWIKNNQPEIYRDTRTFLNAKDYIVYKLTGNLVTEYSDAASTCLLDIRTCEWSDEMFRISGVDAGKLPPALPSSQVAGQVTREAARETGLAWGTPVVCGGGDGVCASVGAGSIDEGSTYCILGSSAWISTVTTQPMLDDKMRTFNWPHLVPGFYVPCGSMQAAGLSYSWLKNQICTSEILEAEKTGKNVYEVINAKIEKSPAGANGLLFLPYLLGERSPRWNPHAKGAFIGLKAEHRREDVLRAVLEGITLNLNIILDIYKQHRELKELLVIGGGAKGKIWRRIMADIFNIPILKPNVLEEATSMGAAVTGGVGVGLFKDFHVIQRFIQVEETQYPDPINNAVYQKLMPIFDASYYALLDIYQQLSAL